MGHVTTEKRQVVTKLIPRTVIKFYIVFGLIVVTAADSRLEGKDKKTDTFSNHFPHSYQVSCYLQNALGSLKSLFPCPL